MALIAQNGEDTMIPVQTEHTRDQYVLFSNDDCDETGTCIDTSAILMKLYSDVQFKHCCICITELYNMNILNTGFKEAHSLLEANIGVFCFKKEVLKNLTLPLSVVLDLSFVTCNEHSESLRQTFMKLTTVEYIKCWCNKINHLLKGKDAGSRAKSHLAKEACIRYSKNCKKK